MLKESCSITNNICPTLNRPAVFIEKLMYVQVLNEQVNFEHRGKPFKGLHRWYSRKRHYKSGGKIYEN